MNDSVDLVTNTLMDNIAEIIRLRHALQLFADPSNWCAVDPIDHPVDAQVQCWCPLDGNHFSDPWQIAADALQQKE